MNEEYCAWFAELELMKEHDLDAILNAARNVSAEHEAALNMLSDDFDDAVTMPYMKLVDGKFINTDTQEIDSDEVEFV